MMLFMAEMIPTDYTEQLAQLKLSLGQLGRFL
jgi:hypothetical protein